MSTHNICFCGEIRKLLCGYPLLSVAMHPQEHHTQALDVKLSQPSWHSCKHHDLYCRGCGTLAFVGQVTIRSLSGAEGR